MAKIYSAPKEVGAAPEITHPFDFEAYEKATQKHIADVVKYAKDNGSSELAGEIVRFPVGDGYAQYVVFSLKPVQLIHLAVHDRWHFQYANRLTATDIRKEVRYMKGMAELFGSKKGKK
jgi:hypothetical protein